MLTRQDFSTRLEASMQVNELSILQLAKKSGISAVMIQYYITGLALPRVDVLEKLCRALACSSDFLLGLRS